MPTTLVLTFPLGRYHATPWDRHVNEGAVELPPSPWRLLRTLYAVWQTRCPELPEPLVHGLLSTLAAPPTFYVPPHTLSHTRHYYPDTTTGTDRVLDAFAVFGPTDQLAVQWPFDLEPAQHDALDRIATAIPYFGRADSICDGSIDNGWAATEHAIWKPLDVAEQTDGYTDATSVLAPEMPLHVETLLARPADVRRGGLRFPVGSRLIAYGLDQPAAERPRTTVHRTANAVTAVRFDLLQPALPPHTDTAIYTDLLRQSALGKLGYNPQGTMLGGRTIDNEPMRGNRHAHYLPVIKDRRLTSLVVWVPATLPTKELDALCEVRTLYDHKRRTPVRVSAIGDVTRIAPELTGPATSWSAITPYTPSRYPKKNRDQWHTFIVDEIHRELSQRGITPPNSVEFLNRPWTSFVRHRPSARLRGDRQQGRSHLPSEFLRLHFDQPVTGPITLGRLDHFGLGLFVPNN